MMGGESLGENASPSLHPWQVQDGTASPAPPRFPLPWVPIPECPPHASSMLTRIQQQARDGQVPVGHAVVQRCVPVAVRQVHHVLQQLPPQARHRAQHPGHGLRLRPPLARHPKPLLGHQARRALPGQERDISESPGQVWRPGRGGWSLRI